MTSDELNKIEKSIKLMIEANLIDEFDIIKDVDFEVKYKIKKVTVKIKKINYTTC